MPYSIVCVKAPFVDDFTKSKFRPCIYLGDSSKKHNTGVICFITSNISEVENYDIEIKNFKDYNLIKQV